MIDLAHGGEATRPVLSEYHAIGSTSGATLYRHGPWKYCHYVGQPPQLFNLETDPGELHDLAADPDSQDTLKACETSLRRHLDPEAVDRRAKQRQGELLAGFGGRDVALARGDLGLTPAPGTAPAFN